MSVLITLPGTVSISGVTYPTVAPVAGQLLQASSASSCAWQTASISSSMISTGPAQMITINPQTSFIALNGSVVSTSEAVARAPVPTAGAISKLLVDVQINGSDTNDVAINLSINGVTQSIGVTIPASATGQFTDSVDSAAFAAGDYLDWIASPASGSDITGSICAVMSLSA